MSGKRVRLTARHRNASDDIPYPGTVNQEDRQFVPFDEYDNFEQTVNHELPDMRTEWRNDSRDEIGFPIAEEHTDVGVKDPGQVVASAAQVRQAAGKAVKLAMLLLGNKVAESLIEAQAKDFMKLGSAGLDRALVRFAKTEELYAAEEVEEKAEEKVEAKKTSAEDEEKVEEKVEAKKAEDKKDLPPEFLENIKKEDGAEDKKEEKKESKKTSAEEVEEKVEAKSKKSADDAEEAEEEVEEKVEAKSKKSADEDDAEEKTAAELDIELMAAEEDESAEDEKSASILSALYEEVKKQGSKSKKSDDDADADDADDAVEGKKSSDDADEDDAPKAKSASVKRGAQKLGGQPRVAGDMSVRDISKIWGETPDISGVFE